MNFHSNLARFNANGKMKNCAGKKKGIAAKIVDSTLLQGQQSVDLFRIAIKCQATRDPYGRRLIGFLKEMDAEFPLMLLLYLQSIIQ